MSIRTLFINDKIYAPAEEAYRTLRTNIQFCSLGKEIRTITMTSCFPNEGKTTTTINIALSFAKAGKKVLFVDADLRKPIYAKGAISQEIPGLSNYLSGMSTFEEVIRGTNIENFYVASCGPKPPNPGELIGTEKFVEFKKEAEERYDLVFFDTPPLGSVIDSAVISAKTDGVILIIEANKVDHKYAERVKDQLDKSNARILGVVLNKIKKTEYKDYYNYYDFSSDPKKSRKRKASNNKEKASI